MIRGATYEIEIAITDKDTGNPIDLTLATGILVGLYGDGRRLFGKWSLVDKSSSGFGEVNITNPVGGLVSVFLEATDSLKALEKMAKVEVVVTFDNANYETGTQISIDTEIELEVVQRSIFEGQTAL